MKWHTNKFIKLVEYQYNGVSSKKNSMPNPQVLVPGKNDLVNLFQNAYSNVSLCAQCDWS